jgi:AcrR family transcriptional regulator
MSEIRTMSGARRGRPRSDKARDAVLAAGADLLLERGLTAVSMDEVAAHAGVSKATIYRWWPSKETLALDALYHEWEGSNRAADTGDVRDDLISLIRPWSRVARRRRYGRVLAALIIAAQTDPTFAEEYRARFIEPRRDVARAVFARAIDRGEIPADTNVEVALDLLFGAVNHRLLHGHAPLNDRFVTGAVDTVLHGIIPRTGDASAE